MWGETVLGYAMAICESYRHAVVPEVGAVGLLHHFGPCHSSLGQTCSLPSGRGVPLVLNGTLLGRWQWHHLQGALNEATRL